MDVHSLIERCINRDEMAWEAFIGKFSGLVYYSARQRLWRNGISFSKEDLDDIVQGIFLEILEKNRLKEIANRKKITAWLSVVSQSRALNYVRKRKERLLGKDEFYRIDNLTQDISSEPRLKGTPLEFDIIIRDFNNREKIILKLNIIYKKTHREIADFMRLPTNTVSTIIHRKKKVLKEKLREFKIE
ncbi:MAG: sigma-70 family RNA polymerase sigma factor [Candidatus Omnitrophota bacterium]